MAYVVRNKRINAYERAVFDVYRDDQWERHVATVEVNGEAGNCLKVLMGALQPVGKEMVWDAIRAYENPPRV